MVDLARERGLVLMADHTYCYTPAVLAIRDLIARGELGEILFVDSVRINLGLVQPDVDVFWDLAPHDLSILDFILPGGLRPDGVSAHGADPIGAGKACVGYLTLPLPGGAIAHVHVNWLSPTKIRQMVIGGSRRTLVWDDLNPQQRLSIYDRGRRPDPAVRRRRGPHRQPISYRLGDTWAPALPEHEALGAMVAEFAAGIRSGPPPAPTGRPACGCSPCSRRPPQPGRRAGALVDARIGRRAVARDRLMTTAAGCRGPGHRRRRHDRLDHRRPAAGRRRRPGRRARQPRPRPPGQPRRGPGRPAGSRSSRATSATATSSRT